MLTKPTHYELRLFVFVNINVCILECYKGLTVAIS